MELHGRLLSDLAWVLEWNMIITFFRQVQRNRPMVGYLSCHLPPRSLPNNI